MTAAFALGTPLLLGCLAALLIARMDGWMSPRAHRWQFILGTGTACAVSALPILILLMEKLAILRRPLGQRLLRYASLDDLAIQDPVQRAPLARTSSSGKSNAARQETTRSLSRYIGDR